MLRGLYRSWSILGAALLSSSPPQIWKRVLKPSKWQGEAEKPFLWRSSGVVLSFREHNLGVSKNQEPYYRPQTTGLLLLQGHPHKGPSICRNRHMGYLGLGPFWRASKLCPPQVCRLEQRLQAQLLWRRAHGLQVFFTPNSTAALMIRAPKSVFWSFGPPPAR